MLTSCTKIIYEDFDPNNEQHENTEQTNNGEDENQDEKNENVVVSVAEFIQNDYSQKSETLGLHSNPQLYNEEIKFFGKKQKYLGIWGIKE